MGRAFEQYEQVAAFLLNEFAAHFGLGRVEGKQIIYGRRSGINWEKLRGTFWFSCGGQ